VDKELSRTKAAVHLEISDLDRKERSIIRFGAFEQAQKLKELKHAKAAT
jgi:hypothetical protein